MPDLPPAKPPRRWFRFSLRTLLIVITLLACWLGWESSIVRRRQAVMKEFEAKEAFRVFTADAWVGRYPPGAKLPPVATVPLVRRLLGDKAIQEVSYTAWYGGFAEADLEKLKQTFPEAEFHEVHPEPCHPGCFPAGTLVDCPQSRRPIESIAAGDSVVTFLPSGERITATVQSVFTTPNRLWRIETEAGELLTTETQPLCLAFDRIVAAGELKPGDTILRSDEGAIQPVKVLAITQTDRLEKVFNLVLGDRKLFLAGGYLARSKPPRAS